MITAIIILACLVILVATDSEDPEPGRSDGS